MFANTRNHVKNLFNIILILVACHVLLIGMPAQAQDQPLMIVKGSGANIGCLLGGSANYETVRPVTCDEKASTWVLTVNGTIQLTSSGGVLCLGTDAYMPNPRLVVVQNCATGTTDVQWNLTATGEIRHALLGLCLVGNFKYQYFPSSITVSTCGTQNSFQFAPNPVGYWRTDYSDLNTGVYQGSDYHCLRADGSITNIYNYFGYWQLYKNGAIMTLRAKNTNDWRIFTSALTLNSATSYIGSHQNVYYPNLAYTVELGALFTRISSSCQ
jgi:hypothetical protein